MTITIHRQARLPLIAMSLAVAAILAGVVFALVQNSGSEPTATRTPNPPAAIAAPAATAHWARLGMVQDGFLPPIATSESAAHWSRLGLVQNGFLPPNATSGSVDYWAKLEMVQDGFLPSIVAHDENEPDRSGGDRHTGPR